jgi:hypothetical protein
MRSNKELLELVLQNLGEKMTEWRVCGLCAVVSIMKEDKIINPSEEHRLYDIIDNNPTEYYGLSKYYFPPREVEPRIEYLKQLIKKYS